MNYVIELLEKELAKLDKPNSILVFEHSDFAEENNQKIESINGALKILNGEDLKRDEKLLCPFCKSSETVQISDRVCINCDAEFTIGK